MFAAVALGFVATAFFLAAAVALGFMATAFLAAAVALSFVATAFLAAAVASGFLFRFPFGLPPTPRIALFDCAAKALGPVSPSLSPSLS